MDIYLAARWTAQPKMRDYASVLRNLGHTVTSRWVDFEIDETKREAIHAARVEGSEDAHVQSSPWAVRDLEDVCKANCLVWFAPSGRRGDSHVEFGMGLALYIRCIVVGPVENVFHSLSQVERYATFADLIDQFTKEPGNGQFTSQTSFVVPQFE